MFAVIGFALFAASLVFGYTTARRFVRARLRYVDSVRSLRAPILAGIGAAVVAVSAVCADSPSLLHRRDGRVVRVVGGRRGAGGREGHPAERRVTSKAPDVPAVARPRFPANRSSNATAMTPMATQRRILLVRRFAQKNKPMPANASTSRAIVSRRHGWRRAARGAQPLSPRNRGRRSPSAGVPWSRPCLARRS